MIRSLSIIIPFYNEEKRIQNALQEIDNFLTKKKFKTEIIFVDDGGTDNTKNLIENYIKQKKSESDLFKLISYKENKGKGYALKQGVLESKLDWVLTTDIDFSVPLLQILKWEEENLINTDCKVYFASRQHPDSEVNSKFYREFLGLVMRIIINFILGIKIKDTQCGFKLYESEIAKILFKDLEVDGFEHDLAIVLSLKKNKFQMLELPVTWTHKDYSKLNILTDPIKMFFGIFILMFKRFFKSK